MSTAFVGVRQTIFEPPNGNCFQACVASLLRCDLDDLPNFAKLWRAERDDAGSWKTTDNQRWWDVLGEIAAKHGCAALELTWPATDVWGITSSVMRDWLGIATVKSPRGNWLHCVIANFYTGEVMWDPFPGASAEGRNVASEDLSSWIIFVSNPFAATKDVTP